jgi:hypothetical protein
MAMGLAASIAELMRGHNCEKLVQYTKQEVTFRGLSGEGGGYKISLGTFSNNVRLINSVTEVMKALDNNQFLLCQQAHDHSASPQLRERCLQVRVMCTIGLTNFQALAALQEPDKPLNPEIKKWMKNMNALVLECMKSFVPYRAAGGPNLGIMNIQKSTKGEKPEKKEELYCMLPTTMAEGKISGVRMRKVQKATKKGPKRKISVSEIMEYQGINTDDMQKAVSILKD